jgi:acyl dehydratase
VDIDYAKSSGLNDVIAHGMLIKAYIGRAITTAASQNLLRGFDTQFTAPTHIGDLITVTAIVDIIEDVEGESQLVIKAEAINQHGVTVAKSKAWIKQV